MPFDGFVMAAVCQELQEKIWTGKIDKIHQPTKDQIILRIRGHRENYRLLLSAHAVAGRIHLTQETKENPTHPPLFCMVLRKHLEGGRITKIVQDGLERVLKIHVEALDELGIRAEKILVVEIMGKHSNIILVDPADNEILDGIHRYTHIVSRHREVLPGRPYIPPPPAQKENPLEVTEARFRELMLKNPLSTKVAEAIITNFLGFSALLAKEVVARAELPDTIRIDDLGDYELIRLWRALQEIVGATKSSSFQPTLIKSPQGLRDYSCFTLIQFPQQFSADYSSISEALDCFYTQQEFEEVFQGRRREMRKIVNGEIDRLEKKIALQQEKLAETVDAEKYRLYGELITAHMYQISRGMEKVCLNNFYQPGETVEIMLDMKLSPAENAQWYFKKYNKAKSAKIQVEDQLEKNREELQYLETVASSLDQVDSLADISEIRTELVDAGYLKGRPVPKGAKKDRDEVSQPLTVESRDGYTILIGKNNQQNDRLTLKIAQPDDLWLHTKDIPGSHVIIRKKPGEEIPWTTIEEAAKLAAWHSKARQSSQVPVDYTLVKNVKKPRGVKPGMVIYTEQKTVFVRPTGPDSY